MNAPIFTPEEQAELDAQARRRGFDGARAYIYALVEQDAEPANEEASRKPTLDELMAMSLEERDYWLEKAAVLAEPYYRNDPELTITANTVDLYEYPDDE
jgi:hypothetical protein